MIASSDLDGIHLEATEHAELGAAVAAEVRRLLGPQRLRRPWHPPAHDAPARWGLGPEPPRSTEQSAAVARAEDVGMEHR